MPYQYRWWYGLLFSLVISTCAGFICLYPEWQHIQVLTQQEKNVKRDLFFLQQHTLKMSEQQASLEKNGPPIMAMPGEHWQALGQLTQLAMTNNIDTQALNLSLWKKQDGQLWMHVVVHAAPESLTHFLFALLKQGYLLMDFDYRLGMDNQLILSADFSATNQISKINFPTDESHTPFCLPLKATLTPSLDDSLQKVEWNQLKLVGVLQQGHHYAALLNLPNNTTVLANTGTVLGKQRAMLSAIQQAHIVITLPDGQHHRVFL